MRPIRRDYDIAGAFVMLSGLLYVPLFSMEGWGPRTKGFLIIGLILIALGLWLRGRRRWLAYACYFLMLFGILGTLFAMSTSSVATWWWGLIILLKVLAAFWLFRILWADKVTPA